MIEGIIVSVCIIGAFAFGFWLGGSKPVKRNVTPLPASVPASLPESVDAPQQEEPKEVMVDLSPPDLFERRNEIFRREAEKYKRSLLD